MAALVVRAASADVRKEPVMVRVSMALACSALLVSSMPAAVADSPKSVTFTKDVAPIFQ